MRFSALFGLLVAGCTFAGSPGEPGETDDGDAGMNVARCGDGVVAGAEQCDFGDLNIGDGCDETCQVEPGFDCTSDGCTAITGVEWQTSSTSSELGANNGAPFQIDVECAPDEVVVAVDGNYNGCEQGSFTGVTELSFSCSRVTFVSGLAVPSGPVSPTGTAGICTNPDPVLERSFDCSNGVLVGVRGADPSGWVDSLQGLCRPLRYDGELAFDGEFASVGQIAGPSPSEEIRCPPGTVVVGFEGNYGQLVDRMRLHCAPLAPTTSDN